MIVTIRLKKSSGLVIHRDLVVKRVEEALANFHSWIERVSVYLEDVNGPRGGNDKKCRCLLHLKRLPTIVLRDQDADLHALIRRITDRAAFAAARSVGRKTSMKRSRHERFAEESGFWEAPAL